MGWSDFEFEFFEQIFRVGSAFANSSGNISYRVGLRAARVVDELEPLKIKGLVLHQPFFGGTQRSTLELRLTNDAVLSPIISDLMWELSLPSGMGRDHKYCNPTVNGGSKGLEKIKSLGWKVFVNGCEGDPLNDRQVEIVKLMEGKGVQVVGNFRADP
ncbi:hypothetical protein PTKIN_Ptkin04bG0126700 [Pterospermum kingtungense]